jgi:hypothetical protein
VEATSPFDLRIQTRKLRTEAGIAKHAAHASDGSTHPLSKEGKSWQEKGADKLSPALQD